jgi:hypothetical protein
MENHETTFSLVISNASYILPTERCYFNEGDGVWNPWFLLDSTAFMTFYIHVLGRSFIENDLSNSANTLVYALITPGHRQKTKR